MLSRIITGSILIVLLLLALYLKEVGLKSLILLFAGFAIFELLTIFYVPISPNKLDGKLIYNSHIYKLGLVIVIFMLSLVIGSKLVINSQTNSSFDQFISLARYISALIATLGLMLFIFFYQREIRARTFFRFFIFIVCYFYIYFAFYLAFGLIEINDNFKIPLYLLEVILIVIATDSFAYFFGKLIGGKKLLIKVSPNKTISGLIFGVLLAIISCYIFRLSFGLELKGFIIFATIISLSSVIGDLLESAVKRYLQIKDTSSILSSHGGVLDRLDGLLLAIIAAKIITIF